MFMNVIRCCCVSGSRFFVAFSANWVTCNVQMVLPEVTYDMPDDTATEERSGSTDVGTMMLALCSPDSSDSAAAPVKDEDEDDDDDEHFVLETTNRFSLLSDDCEC